MIPYIDVDRGGKTYNVSPSIGEYTGSTVNTWRDILVVDYIGGLGPVPADIITNKLALSPGERFNAATLRMRDIEIHYAAVQVGEPLLRGRRQLSEAFPPGQKVRLTLLDPERNINRYIIGYVESLDHDIFGQPTGETVRIRCPDPYIHTPQKSHQIRGLDYQGNDQVIEGKTTVKMSGYIAGSSPEKITWAVNNKPEFVIYNLGSHVVQGQGYVRYDLDPKTRSVMITTERGGNLVLDNSVIDPRNNHWEIFDIPEYESRTIKTTVFGVGGHGSWDPSRSWIDAYYGQQCTEVEI